MIDSRAILNRFESAPFLFSFVHFLGAGKDTNRRALVNLIRRGDNVIEVGANVGTYTSLFARLVGKEGHVHAFEPVRANFERLVTRSSTSANISVQLMGVGNSEGQQEILIPG